jgi:hypothetical protein
MEFTATLLVFLTLLFGVIEFSLAFYQWNAATKAVQFGARYAAVSNPVMKELKDIDGTGGANTGDPYAGTFDIICDGSLATPTCTCTGSECPASCCTYLPAAMTGIVSAMQKAYSPISSKNVVVRYTFTGLGYAGRVGGPVPTITVSLKGVQFKFILLSFLLRNSMSMPGLSTTVTGEDLSGQWSG